MGLRPGAAPHSAGRQLGAASFTAVACSGLAPVGASAHGRRRPTKLSTRHFADMPRLNYEGLYEAKRDGNRASGSDPNTKTCTTYTEEEINEWRANYGFPRSFHSIAQFGYTDDDLCDWRRMFDTFAKEDDQIYFETFAAYVHERYDDMLSDDQVKLKVQHFWSKFDPDRKGYIDFGGFIKAGLALDVDWAKERIRKDGAEVWFAKYAEEDYMLEADLAPLMRDCKFLAATDTDASRLMLLADKDMKGQLSLEDFQQWVDDSHADVPR